MFAPERFLFFCSWLVGLLVNFGRRPLRRAPKRILVIRRDELGDMVTTLPVFELFKKYYPQAELTVFCKPQMALLLQNHPAVDVVATEWQQIKGKYDYLADLRGDWKSLRLALKLWAHRVDRGSHRFMNRFLKREQGHEVDLNVRIIAPLLPEVPGKVLPRLYPSKRQEQQAALFLQRNDIVQFVVFHTGARKLLRRWALQKWAELAVYLYQRHELQVVFVGGDEDAADVEKIRKKLPFETFSFIGQGDLLTYAALAGKARLMVGNESGPMHIAAAMGVPVLALFGPGQPEVFAPYGEGNRFLHVKLPCHPCDQIHCVHPKNPCINRIEVQDVLRELVTLLG